MRKELEQKLMDEFPFMEAQAIWSSKKLGIPFPCECSDGWYTIIYNICKELNELYISKNVNLDKIFIIQIKEKWGALNFYTNGLIDGGYEIVEKYERQSSNICEICGEQGELKSKGSWYRTLCDKHAEELGYSVNMEEYI